MKIVTPILAVAVMAGCVAKDVSELADEQRRHECRFVTDAQDYVQCLKYGVEHDNRYGLGTGGSD